MKLTITRPVATLSRTVILLLTASVLLASLMSLTGCGSGSTTGSNATSATGRFVLTVKWPAPTRLIPAASASINAVLTSAGTVAGTVLSHQLLVRPTTAPWTTTVTFNSLHSGAVMLAATAYPNADGTGVAQAIGSAPATITAGAPTSVTVNMASTIDHLAITPASLTIAVGAFPTLTETAFDVQGSIVLTAPQNISWLSGTPANATIDGTGVVTGIQAGTSVITVTESESGKSATTTLTITAPAFGDPLKAVVDNTGKFVYVSNDLTKTISQFKINTDGTLSPLTPSTVAVANVPVYLLVNPASGAHTLYASGTDGNNGTLYQFNINTDGTLTPLSPASVTGTAAPVNVLIDPAGKNLYEADSLHGIRAFRVQADSTLTQNGPDFNDINTQYSAAAIAPDGKTLYACGTSGPQFTPSIRIDHINSDGTLTNMGSVADTAFGMRVAPSGPFLIVFNDAGITTYLIGATGTLTKGASLSSTLAAPIQTAITPNGKNLYLAASVVNSNSKSIEQFAVHADGSLTALSPAVVSVGNSPFDIVVTPDGKFLYVVNSADSTLSQFKINADGTLTPLSPATVPG